MGYLVWTLFKNLIADIHKKLDTQHGMIVALIDRIRQMDNDMDRIDTLVRTALKLPPDVDRISRADGKRSEKRLMAGFKLQTFTGLNEKLSLDYCLKM